MTDKQSKRKPSGAAAMGAGPGRPKGSTNKVTREIKDMISQALHNVGGVAYLEQRANDPKTQPAFLALVGKAMPLQVSGDPSNPIQHSIKVSFE